MIGEIVQVDWTLQDHKTCQETTQITDLQELKIFAYRERGQKTHWVRTIGALWNPNILNADQLWDIIPGEKITIAIKEAHIPQKILEIAMADGELLRSLIAMRNNLPRSFQERLATDPDHSVRKMLLLNETIDEDIRVAAALLIGT